MIEKKYYLIILILLIPNLKADPTKPFQVDQETINLAMASRLAYDTRLKASSLEAFNSGQSQPVFGKYHCIGLQNLKDVKKDFSSFEELLQDSKTEDDHSHKLENTGFHGVTFYDPDNAHGIVAFRGTVPSLEDSIKADVGIFDIVRDNLGVSPEDILRTQYNTVAQYYYRGHPWLRSFQETAFRCLSPLSHIIPLIPSYEYLGAQQKNISVLTSLIAAAELFFVQAQATIHTFNSLADVDPTGHSSGGLVAQAVGLKKNIPTQTFNAPGVKEYSIQSNQIPEHLFPIEITNHRRTHDVVGTFGTHDTVVEYDDIPAAGYGPSRKNPWAGIEKFCEDNHSIDKFCEYLKTFPKGRYIEEEKPYTIQD